MAVQGHPLPSPRTRRGPAAGLGHRGLLLVGLGLAALVAILAWVLVGRGDDVDAARTTRAPAAAVTLDQLTALAGAIPHPVYWAGRDPSARYEFTQTKDGRTYVRYLSPDAKPGAPRAEYLTVGTYPQSGALATLKATAAGQGAPLIKLRDGGLAFQDTARPTSVYLAYPASDFQVEVFDPSADRAAGLVRAGKVGAVVQPSSVAATRADLRSLGRELGHPVFWAGGDTDATYELTRTSDGRVFVRYLTGGAAVGDSSPDFLTVGTYPQKDALAKLRSAATAQGASTMPVAGGGLAYVDPTGRRAPTSPCRGRTCRSRSTRPTRRR
jgi:hypothetical protein